MLNNQKIIDELKSENIDRINFFKDKIKEELTKMNISGEEELVNNILNTAIESCDDNVKIPFLFHIKAIIKNIVSKDIDEKNKTGVFTKLEYNIINLYLNKKNGKYLSRGIIADRLGINMNEILKTIDKLNEDNDEIEKVFPNYKDKIKERESYFEKTTLLSEEKILLIGEFCGGFGKSLTIDQIAKKYNRKFIDVRNELVKAFMTLKNNKNLDLILKRYPNIKDDIFRKSKALNVPLQIDSKNQIKLNLATKILNQTIPLNPKYITMLDLLSSYSKKEITVDMIKEAGFKDVSDFIEARKKFFDKDVKKPSVIECINNSYKELDIEKLIKQPKLSSFEYKVLNILCENDSVSEKILSEKYNISYRSFMQARSRVINKLKDNNDLLEMVLLVMPNLDLNRLDAYFTNDEISILTILNENPNISNKELLKRTDHDKASDFISKKGVLLKRIRKNNTLLEIVSLKFPNIKIKKSPIDEKLNEDEKKLIIGLKEEQGNDFVVDEVMKRKLFEKLRKNETLKREALTINPELVLTKNITGISLTFTSMEVDFLQEFCLVKDNNLIYQSLEDIAKSLNLSKSIIEIARGSSKAKVIKNMIVGNNLDNLLWTNFTDEFITRDNFSHIKSININEECLKNISINNVKSTLNEGIKLLEKSIFKDYVSGCSEKEKIILALRLGFFNNRFFTSSEVANLLNADEIYVIDLTKDCLSKSKEAFIDSNKILSKGKK